MRYDEAVEALTARDDDDDSDLNWSHGISDFEIGMRNALAACIVWLLGCFFHFTGACRRYLEGKEVRLKAMFVAKGKIADNLRFAFAMLMSTAFIPEIVFEDCLPIILAWILSTLIDSSIKEVIISHIFHTNINLFAHYR